MTIVLLILVVALVALVSLFAGAVLGSSAERFRLADDVGRTGRASFEYGGLVYVVERRDRAGPTTGAGRIGFGTGDN